MATKERKLIYRLEAENAKYLRKIEQSEKRLKRYANQTKRQSDVIKHAFGDMQNKITGILTAGGLALGIRQLTRITDQYTLLRGRLKLVTDSEAELVKVEQALFESAQRTRSEYASTVELYARVARNAENLGLSQRQLLTLTEATNQAIQISGSTAQESAAGVVQFAQALASGELRGDELRSVLENMPRLAQAIADGLKTDIGGLRDLAEQGELTAERVTQALLGQAGVIESEFGQLDRTVGQAMTQLANETARAFSGTDVQPLIDSIDEFRELVSDPQMVESLTTLAAALVTVAGGAANFASEFAGLGDQIAVNLAAISGNLTPLDELEQQIKDVDRAIKGGLSTPLRYLFASDAELQQIRESLLEQKRLLKQQQELAMTGRTPADMLREVVPSPLALPGAPAATVDVPDPAAVKAMDAAYKELQKALQGMLTPQQVYNQQIATAAELLSAGKITQDEYNQALQAYKIELEEANGVSAKHQADLKKAAELTQAAVPPLVRMVQEVEEWKRLLDAGLISQQTFDANIAQLNAMADKTGEASHKMSVFADEAARNMQGAFADFLFDPMDEGIEGLAKNFGNMLRRLAAEAAASEIFDWIKGLANGGGGGSTSNAGTWASLVSAFAGFFDTGGNIPSGQFGVVGERGPELVSGPAHVISREDTANMMRGGGVVNVEILNYGQPMDAAAELLTDGTLRIVAKRVKDEIRGDLGNGRGFARDLEQRYQLAVKGTV